MRAALLVGSFLFGVATMSPAVEPTDIQDKPAAPFTHFVKWERLDKAGKVTYTAEAVSALAHNGKWVLKGRDIRDGKPATGDRITGPDGKVYTVTKVMTDTVSPGSVGAFRLTVDPPVKTAE